MSVEELRFVCIGGKLHFTKFAGEIIVLPIVNKIGDQIKIDHNQAHLLMLWLQEYLK